MINLIKKFKTKSGFTLIELLVVISIIGLLSSIIYASFGEARSQSRDKVRKSDLKMLQLTLEAYKAQNGVYPPMGCGAAVAGGEKWSGPGPIAAAWGTACPSYINNLTPDFISKLPSDPRQASDKGFIYSVDSLGTKYKIMVHRSVETLFVSSYNDEFARCPNACGAAAQCVLGVINDIYAVYSSGAECW